MKVLVTSHAWLCDPMHYSPPGSSIHGILQARILDWVAIPFSRWSSQPRNQTGVSCIAGRFFTVCATRLKAQLSYRAKEEEVSSSISNSDFSEIS